MAEIKYLMDTALQTVIDDNASLTNNSRAAADYDNETELDLFCNVFLEVQFDAGPPGANSKIGELYILPGDGESTERFPDGGDAGLGTDDDPQDIFLVGTFETINPSTTTDETLSLGGVQLYPHGNRFVFKNVSGQTMDSTWQLDIKPYKLQSV